MNLPELIRTVRWMVRDTFKQSVATKLFWVMLAAAAVATLVCLSVTVTGDPPPLAEPWDHPGMLPKQEADKAGPGNLEASGVRVITGEMTLGFGAFEVSVGRGREDSVRQLQLVLVALVADTAGVLLALLWTAGFLPTFLEPQAATVLLAKPAPRWAILLGKYVGVVLFVGLAAVLYIGGTWLALGLRTGVWTGAYWLAVPILMTNFGVFYAVSAFLAVWTRSTVASAFGTLLFWAVCTATNVTRHHLAAFPPDGLTPTAMFFSEVGYWVLPKPIDLGAIFFDALGADKYRVQSPEIQVVQAAGEFRPGLSVAASVAFAAGTLGLACYEFEEMDY